MTDVPGPLPSADPGGSPVDAAPPFPALFRGLFLVALATLVYQLALIRVLSFTIWYHFAYVVLSCALLGFGASGAWLSVRPGLGGRDVRRTLSLLSLAAGATGAASLGAMTLFPLDPLRMLSDRREFLVMLGYLVGGTVPFFFSGLVVSLALRTGAGRVDRLYFWDLLGAAVGCALAVPLMNALTPPGALLAACACFSAAAAAFASPRMALPGLAATLVLAAFAAFGPAAPLTAADSKHLSIHVNLQKMVPIFSEWTALFRTDVVEKRAAGPALTNDYEWGLSHRVTEPVQRMWALVTHDGSAGTPIYDLREGKLAFLDDHVLRLPYRVAPAAPKVLVIGVGGGRDIVTALRFGASHVTGVELNPVTVDVIRRRYHDHSAGLFDEPRVTLEAGEGRHFVERSRDRFDVIQLTGVDTLSAQSSGAYVLAENYLYTTEAFHAYLDRLTPGGILSVVTGDWILTEPQATARMLLVARRALEERGVRNPADHLAVIASNRILTSVVVRPRPFSPEETSMLQAEADRLAFAVLVLPGRPSHPAYADLLGTHGEEHRRALDKLTYVIDPVTDDNPFFFRFFRWRDVFSQQSYGPMHTSALGQLVLVVLAAILTLVGLLFVLGPLVLLRRRGLPLGAPAAAYLSYFTAIGAGFMLLEISLMQRLVLYLGYPTYALSVVLFSLLGALGAGSFASRRFFGRERRALSIAAPLVVALVLFYRFGLPVIERSTLGAPFAARVAIAVLLLAPLGLTLGIFFPLGIRCVEKLHPDLIPWAWAVNGCASVVASVTAVLVAMTFGFGAVWFLAAASYVGGVVAVLRFAPLPAPDH